ncbi:MAG: hypothetical protein UE068_14395, partial [Paludibacteraceae bacterium]|nr:hypothetical protein [Paludibacteraceae bacterium]
MKETGIVWIGKIPIDWNIMPAGGVFDEVKEKNKNLKYLNPLSFKYGEIVDKDIKGDVDEDVKETISTYTVVHPNTIMINSLNLNYDFISQRVAIVRKDGVITSAYLAVKPDEEIIYPRFVLYLLKSYDAQQVFHGMGSGVRKTLKFQDFKHVFVVAPTLKEQQAIANYLDGRCSKIDEIIADATASIEEYQELKQAVIFENVTRGFENSKRTKRTGIFWAERIPDGWDVVKVAQAFSVELGKMLDAQRISGKRLKPYLRNADVQWNGINVENLNEMDFSEDEDERYSIKPGDLLVCEGGDIGKSFIVPDDFPDGIYYQKALHRVRSYDNDINSLKWLRYILYVMSKFGFFNAFSGEKAT